MKCSCNPSKSGFDIIRELSCEAHGNQTFRRLKAENENMREALDMFEAIMRYYADLPSHKDRDKYPAQIGYGDEAQAWLKKWGQKETV